MKFAYRSVLVIALSLVTSSCSVATVDAYRIPHVDLHVDSTYFVIINPKDERQTAELIKSTLKQQGIGSISGSAEQVPSKTKVIVRYGAQWVWDVTWYLLDLDIRLYDSESQLILAYGNSRRYSLGRKPAKTVVEETLNAIFENKQE